MQAKTGQGLCSRLTSLQSWKPACTPHGALPAHHLPSMFVTQIAMILVGNRVVASMGSWHIPGCHENKKENDLCKWQWVGEGILMTHPLFTSHPWLLATGSSSAHLTGSFPLPSTVSLAATPDVTEQLILNLAYTNTDL